MLRGINQQVIFEDEEDSEKLIETIDKKQRDKYIKKLREKGLSIRHISRLTGVSKGIVEKIL